MTLSCGIDPCTFALPLCISVEDDLQEEYDHSLLINIFFFFILIEWDNKNVDNI